MAAKNETNLSNAKSKIQTNGISNGYNDTNTNISQSIITNGVPSLHNNQFLMTSSSIELSNSLATKSKKLVEHITGTGIIKQTSQVLDDKEAARFQIIDNELKLKCFFLLNKFFYL